MPRAFVNGVALYHESAGAGPPVVLVHGYACGIRSWDAQVARLAGRHRVIAYDVRGHGLSDAPTDPSAYSQPISVEDLRALLLHLGIPRAAVAGLSMGGNIALNLALAYPDMLTALVVADTGAGSDDPPAARATWEAVATLLEQRGIEAFADAALELPLFARYAAQGPERERFIRSCLMTNRAHGLAHTARRVLAARPPIYALEAGLRALRVPTLLMVGELDEACAAPHRFMAGAIPDARSLTLPGIGHLANLEAPEAFTRALEDFLAAPRRAAPRAP